jgi:hypothetical protein
MSHPLGFCKIYIYTLGKKKVVALKGVEESEFS